MLFIILNFLFNGYLLTWILIYSHGAISLVTEKFTHVSLSNHFWIYYIAGFGSVFLLSLLGLTTLGHYLIRPMVNARKAAQRELNRVNPLIDEVLLQATLWSNTFKIKKIKVLVSDLKEPNIQAFGWNSIIITRGLLNNADDEELKAVLAYAIGHLYYKDSVTWLVLVFSSACTVFFMWLYSIWSKISSAILEQKIQNPIILFILLCPLGLFLPIVIINFIGVKILNLGLLFLAKHYEYRADRFASNIGYKDGLIRFLEKLDAVSCPDNSLLGRVLASHPAPMKRIDILESGKVKRQGLWVDIIGYISIIAICVGGFFYVKKETASSEPTKLSISSKKPDKKSKKKAKKIRSSSSLIK